MNIMTKVVFSMNGACFPVKIAILEVGISMQRISAFLIPERYSAIEPFMSTDVYEFKLEARTKFFLHGKYVAICQGCSHVICVHNSVGIIAAGSSPVSGVGPKPCQVRWADQVRMPVWLIATGRICVIVVRKDNALHISTTTTTTQSSFWLSLQYVTRRFQEAGKSARGVLIKFEFHSVCP